RLSHSRSGITRKDVRPQNEMTMPADPKQFILLPSIARRRYKDLLSVQQDLQKEAEKSTFNEYQKEGNQSLGIIACGIAVNYLAENFSDHKIPYPYIKITHYPIPYEQIFSLAESCRELLILEEGYPFVEEQLKGFLPGKYTIKGRLDGSLPRDGELSPALVANALGIEIQDGLKVPDMVANRPPALCNGCGHVDVYNALNEAMDQYGKGRVFSDIGCYTLGALPPFESISSCVDMGASVTMAKGASDAGLRPAVAVIGDSTFTHSGMTGLLDAVIENTPITVVISDNSTTGMTGGQKSSATGRLVDICQGLGVHPDHIKTFVPLKKNHDENVEVIRKELQFEGVSVILAQRECIQTAARRKRLEKKTKMATEAK
ncbi:MAG TPA: thiamine pyrophosphate-dependent enzyme, partial [Bacteroidales bacterium]|nr:thiamine pyrophosphate-dependent enzyme [Bacteroidales bacterium]